MTKYFPVVLFKPDLSSLFSFHPDRNATVPVIMACDKTVMPVSHTPTPCYVSVLSSEQAA